MQDPKDVDLNGDGNDFARSLLRSRGLASSPIEAAGGWSNDVWLAPTHVVRLSSGRFRDSFAHEAKVLRLLPSEVPHAEVLEHGRVGRREWLILRRVPGIPLAAAWSTLRRDERQEATRQLGEILHTLHRIAVPKDLRNPWLDDAIAPGGDRRNAYRVAPDRFRDLLDAAYGVAGVDRVVLDEVGAFIADRLIAFPSEPEALVHGDAHFGNVMWDNGRISGLLDFEAATIGPPDLELDTLLRFSREPELSDWPSSPVKLTSQDFVAFADWLADAYPMLFAHPHLVARLDVYDALWQLVQLLHYPPGSGPPDPWEHLQTLMKRGERRAVR